MPESKGGRSDNHAEVTPRKSELGGVSPTKASDMVEMLTSDKKQSAAENAETIKKNLSIISSNREGSMGSKRGLIKLRDQGSVVLEEKF